MRSLLSLFLCFLLGGTALADETSAFDQRRLWLHEDTWLLDSNGDMRRDLARAEREGKSLMILWEQQGCVYCDRLYSDNFLKPEIREMLHENFLVVRLNMMGKRLVTGPDGTEMTEAQLARQQRVTGTPTTVVYNSARVLDTARWNAEAFRMPGYLKSFYYLSVLGYFLSDQHDDVSLEQFVQTRAEDFKDRGINPERW